MNKIWDNAIAALIDNQPEAAIRFIHQGMKKMSEQEFVLQPTSENMKVMDQATDFLKFDHWQVS